MTNPYRGYGCPVSGEDFIGRTEILAAIGEGLQSGNVFLTGLHRVGKSSVAQEIKRRLLENGCLVCRPVNLHTLKSERDLFRSMLSALGSPVAKTMPTGEPGEVFDEVRDAFEIDYRKRASRCIMIIDEMDGLLTFEDPVTTLNRLREIAYYKDLFGINFLFISSRSLETIERKIVGSNLSGICENRFLGPFSMDEAAVYIARCGLKDELFVKEVYGQTGGVPYLMAVLMSKVCELSEGRIGDFSIEDRTRLLTESVAAVAHPFLEYYEKIERMLSVDDGCWGALIGLVIGPVMEKKNPCLANMFREYGIINCEGNCPNRHFTDYLEMCSRGIAPFEDLKSVEVCLRRLVKDRFADEFGSSWSAEVRKSLPAVAPGLDVAEEKLRREMRQFHLASEDDLIEYTDMGDLKTIITSNVFWRLFQHPIGMGLQDFMKHMDRIIPMRNRTMHHRPGYLLPPEQVAMARQSCRELLARIK